MWQLVRGIEGLRDAAIAFDTPVISGNVSLYNETEGRAIPPTPTIAMVGTFDDVTRHLKQYFKVAGDAVLMVRSASPSLAASEYAALFGAPGHRLEPIDLGRERKLIDGLVECSDRRLIRSAHDVSEGGLAVALAEACFNPSGLLGVEVKLGGDGHSAGVLFGEGPSTVVISAPMENIQVLHQVFAPLEIVVIGRVTAAPRLKIGKVIDEDVDTLRRRYEDAIPGRLKRP
jgi:phosphoribosylformylglycinamidine synthase